PLVGVGIAAGLSSRRISSDALELQATSALQQALLDSTVDGICLTDVTGNLVLANAPLQRFATDLGLPQSGTVAERVLAPADRHLDRLRDAFVAAVSHELRTPLTSMSGFLEMLGDEEQGLSASGRTYLSVIRRGTGRLQRIVEDLLLVAQIEADRLELNPAPADLAALATATVEAAWPAAADKGVELSLDVADRLPLYADAERLSQVLEHL